MAHVDQKDHHLDDGLWGSVEEAMVQPQQSAVGVFVQHSTVEEGRSDDLTLDAVDKGVYVAQQGGELQQKENYPDDPMDQSGLPHGGVVVVYNVPGKNKILSI